ncbi:MAG: histidine phosphotransferase [bacterium]|nr:histidine phosphotransferase [bacterium]
MGDFTKLSDLDLAALVASKICHDAIGPMTAVGFGLDVLDEEDDDKEQLESALSMIRNGVGTITSKLQFSRLAFGAAGSSGFEIDLQDAQAVARNYVESDNKHKVEWNCTIATLPKNHVKLLLNLVAISVGTVPLGGTITINIDGDKDHPSFAIKTSGSKARVPEGIVDLVNCCPAEEVDARSIQPYFAGRVAIETGASITIAMDGEDVLLSARFS